MKQAGNLVNMIVIDSGSGSIKTGTADVNSTTGEVGNVQYNSLFIQLAKDMERQTLIREIEGSGLVQNLYDTENHPLNLCQFFEPSPYSESIKFYYGTSSAFLGNYVNKFSEAVKETYVSQITSAVAAAVAKDPSLPVEVSLIGTAALRKADDGQLLVNALEQNIHDQLGVTNTHFKIISQTDEGVYGFRSGISALKANPDRVVAWDIGGGSMQLTGMKDGKHEVLEGVVASSTFQKMAMDSLGRTDSIYPLNVAQVQDVIDLGKDRLNFGAEKEAWLGSKQSQGNVEIVGVGNIHESLLATMKQNNLLGSDAVSYSRNDLTKLVNLFTDKTSDQVKSMIPKGSEAFIENYFINAMLVKAGMEKYGIDDVKVVKVSNAQALMAESAERVVLQHQEANPTAVEPGGTPAPSQVDAAAAASQNEVIAELSHLPSETEKAKKELPPPVTAHLPDLLTQVQLGLALARMTGLDEVVSNAYSFVSSHFNRDPKPITVTKDLEETNNKLHKRLMKLAKIPKLIDEIHQASDEDREDAAKGFIKEFADIDKESKALREACYKMKNPSQEDLEVLAKQTKKLNKRFVERMEKTAIDFPELTPNRLANNSSLVKDRFESLMDSQPTSPTSNARSLSDEALDQTMQASETLKKAGVGLLRRGPTPTSLMPNLKPLSMRTNDRA